MFIIKRCQVNKRSIFNKIFFRSLFLWIYWNIIKKKTKSNGLLNNYKNTKKRKMFKLHYVLFLYISGNWNKKTASNWIKFSIYYFFCCSKLHTCFKITHILYCFHKAPYASYCCKTFFVICIPRILNMLEHKLNCRVVRI